MIVASHSPIELISSSIEMDWAHSNSTVIFLFSFFPVTIVLLSTPPFKPGKDHPWMLHIYI